MHDTDYVAIFTGGDARNDVSIPDATYVIAADSGYDHARDRSVAVDLLIGDLDSISDDGLRHAEDSGVEMDRHPAAKDATDLELALDAAIRRNAAVVDLIGGEGGDIAHLFGIASLIASDRYAATAIRWHTETGTVHVVSNERMLRATAPVGTRVSLVPTCDTAGVTVTGLEWPLTDEPLPRGSTRGLSNTTTSPEFTVQVGIGTLLTIVEGSRS